MVNDNVGRSLRFRESVTVNNSFNTYQFVLKIYPNVG